MHLDYCISIFVGLPGFRLVILNCAAQVKSMSLNIHLLSVSPAYLVKLCSSPSLVGTRASSAGLNKVFMFLLLTPSPGRAEPSQWLAPRFGMASLWLS